MSKRQDHFRSTDGASLTFPYARSYHGFGVSEIPCCTDQDACLATGRVARAVSQGKAVGGRKLGKIYRF
jgi:hypothetical protein